MKWHPCLKACVIGTLALQASVAAARPSTADFDALLARVDRASTTNDQSTYSIQLHKSVNAAAVRHLEHVCTEKHAGATVQTFTLLGVMRLDGVLKAPIPLPDNPFTACIADNMSTVTFPLPPGTSSGWPVAMQFDGTTGKLLYAAGDRQSAMPPYRQRPRSRNPWLYTPVPLIPAGLHNRCKISVWMGVDAHGRVGSVDVGNSSCSPVMEKAVVAAASQWLNLGAKDAQASDSMDVQISFSIGRSNVRVKL